MGLKNFKLERGCTGLLVIDVQEALLPSVERYEEVLGAICKIVKCFQIFQMPIILTEQYPEGLGKTCLGLKQCLSPTFQPKEKTSFSCLGDPEIGKWVLSTPVSQWVLIGIEAHICVLQTAKDLLAAGKEVAVINDAISSRSIYDFSTAIAEMRDLGIRVTSSETIVFELLTDAKASEFKAISRLIKERCACCHTA